MITIYSLCNCICIVFVLIFVFVFVFVHVFAESLESTAVSKVFTLLPFVQQQQRRRLSNNNMGMLWSGQNTFVREKLSSSDGGEIIIWECFCQG